MRANIPCTLNGEEKQYVPDYLIHVKAPAPASALLQVQKPDLGEGESLNLIVEVSGEARKDKAAKVAQKFRVDNPNLADTMRTHLVYDLDGWGILENDYHNFIEKRGEVVLTELKKRLEPELN